MGVEKVRTACKL